MKKFFLIVLLLLVTFECADAQTKKNGYVSLGGYFSGIPGSFRDYFDDGHAIGMGLGLDGMVGNHFSIGIGISYLNMMITPKCPQNWTCHDAEQNFDAIGGGVGLTFLGRITDWLYYVPSVSFVVTGLLSDNNYSSNVTYSLGASLLGVEFRLCDALGFRICTMNVSCPLEQVLTNRVDFTDAFFFAWEPEFALCVYF